MSAFVVNLEHLAFLAACTDSQFRDRNVNIDASPKFAEMVAVLHAENMRSVNYRYRENKPCEPIEIDWRAVNAKRNALYSRGGKRAVARAALMGISCVEYQSCETPDWRKTEAFRLLGEIAVRVAHDAAEENSEWEMRF